ncbi:MAG: EscU/YscU/HrcU family type III secretion system export apparatus switch protein [Deltaproteobacteria bacterium]|nr:EscU/YscU/HrcU family type III secretion system export apparatus switch protein [Deltaproteobacteria bacterium]
MAEEGGAQERTEEATPRRLREARKKGQVARSRDLNTVVILIGAVGILAALSGFFAEQFRLVMAQAFAITSADTLSNEELLLHLRQAIFALCKIMAPYLGGVLFVALAVGFLQVGPVFSGEPMKLQMKRLNIVENVKNMMKVTTLVELFKNIAKLGVVFLLAYLVIRGSLTEVLLTVLGTPSQAADVAADIVIRFLVRVLICFSVIALIDLMVQRWHYKKQLRMTKEEVKREYKQDEGDPLIKSARKQLHQELAMGDVRRAVAAADMLVVNPTEVAVALKYDSGAMVAPQVLAKGQRLFAQLIRELAEEFRIPIMQNIPLAWALLELEIGDEIPEELYGAVAELLLIVYRMKGQGIGAGVPRSE